MEEARFASTSGRMPHVKPVSFVFRGGAFYIATDYTTRTYKNIKDNPRAAITVDVYKPGGHKAVISQVTVYIMVGGE